MFHSRGLNEKDKKNGLSPNSEVMKVLYVIRRFGMFEIYTGNN